MQRFGISFPIHFHQCALCLCPEIVWLDSQYALELRLLFSITPEKCATICDVVERVNVTRIELKCPLEVSCRFFPAPLTPFDTTHQKEYPGIIWQTSVCNFQFSQSALIIEVPIIKMPCSHEVGFAGIWTDAKCFLNGCFCCCQPRRSMVREIKLVMVHREIAIRIEK